MQSNVYSPQRCCFAFKCNIFIWSEYFVHPSYAEADLTLHLAERSLLIRLLHIMSMNSNEIIIIISAITSPSSLTVITISHPRIQSGT